jgi:ribose-phosphate pyrophosphokinase
MEKIIFSFPGNELLAKAISKKTGIAMGEMIMRDFPDEENYLRILSDVSGQEAVLICSLDHPNQKSLSLFFLAKTVRELGAGKVTLVSPYLAYMRQDKQFLPGEAVTSSFFADLLSNSVDELITIDPHLHRRHAMSEIYSIPCKVLHASKLISEYIRHHVPSALLIGPDSESRQWVEEVAADAGIPFIILNKERLGDREVKVVVTGLQQYKGHTPVLVDDIISTAHTLIETISHLKAAGLNAPVCIGVHPIFAGNAYDELMRSGTREIVTCNTIDHISNKIDISDMIAEVLR